MNKYKDLIREAAEYYNSSPAELRNIRSGQNVFNLTWCDGLVDEINLWTYWQGRGADNPDVMIIGQDFGSCTDGKNKGFYEKCVKSPLSESVSTSEEYIKILFPITKEIRPITT